jgi:hypothetical protein
LLADVDLVTLKFRVVGEQGPRQRVVVLADAHEAAKAHDRVGDLAADLVDHDPLDIADLVAVRAVDRGSLDLVAADEAVAFAGVEFGTLSVDNHDD